MSLQKRVFNTCVDYENSRLCFLFQVNAVYLFPILVILVEWVIHSTSLLGYVRSITSLEQCSTFIQVPVYSAACREEVIKLYYKNASYFMGNKKFTFFF